MMTTDQREQLIDAYSTWFVKSAERVTLEWMAHDAIHEELHSLSASDLMSLLEEDCPELLEI